VKIRAFQGLRPPVDKAAEVACVPYDVVNTAEARQLAEGLPHSMLHVVRPEIDLPDGTDPYSDAVYSKAVENFHRLQEEGALVRESAPSLYLYQQVWKGHCQTGLVAVCHVEDYENDIIKKHEKTRPQKEDDRTRVTSELSANPGPVFLTYQDEPGIDRLVETEVQADPLFAFTAPDGVEHRGWKVADPNAYIEAFDRLAAAYVADGHHRSASAARVGRERREANPQHSGEEDYNWFLAVLFPASQLKVLAYNRLVHDLQGKSPEAFLEEVRAITTVTEGASPVPASRGQLSMYLDGRWFGVDLPLPENPDPVSALDVSILQERILAPLLGIDDPRTSERIEFIGGIRGSEELERRVDRGDGSVAFSMFPVGVDQLMQIADAGQIMAPKSTWFEPKLRSGLFIHTF
jgi:uncharacterized protein (DUF1015 family)